MRRGGSESLFFAPGQVDDFLSTDFLPTTVTSVRPFVWVFGGDRLQVNSTHTVVYDAGNGTGTPSIVVINAAPEAVSIR